MSRQLGQIFGSETLAALDEYVSAKVREELKEARPSPEGEPEFVSVKTASARFDLSESTLRDWIRLGKLTKYKLNGCVRLKLSEIVRELENK